MKLNKLLILILLVLIPASLAEIKINLNSVYPLKSVPINGSSSLPSVPVAFQVNYGAQVWFDQGTTQSDKSFFTFYLPEAVGNYTLYVSCAEENIQKTFCVGTNEQCGLGEAVMTSVTAPSASPTQSGGGSGWGKCMENWSCSTWSWCNATLEQSRTCYDQAGCSVAKTELQNCTACLESWICSAWSSCQNGYETRTCYDEHQCLTENQKPVLQQSCEITSSAPVKTTTASYTPPVTTTKPTAKPVVVAAKLSFFETYKYWLISGFGGLILLVVIIILIVRHFRSGKGGEAGNFGDLKEWIKAEKQTGMAKEQLKQALKQNTEWTDEEFEKAYSTVEEEQKPANEQPPVSQ